MGVIKKQSIRASVFTYIGFGLGAVNLLLLYPNYFTPEQLGLTQVFFAIAAPLVALGSVGVLPTVSKFFPYYKKHLPPKQNDFLRNSLLIGVLGFGLLMFLCYLNQDFVFRKFGKSPLLVDYFYLMPIYASGMLVFTILSVFINNYRFTTYTAFSTQILLRLMVMVFIISMALNFFDFSFYMHLFAMVYWVMSLVLIWKLKTEKSFYFPVKFSKVTRRLKKKIAQFGLFYFGINVIGSLSLFIDVIALAGLQGLAQTAYFTVAMYFISVIVVPQSAIINISTPIISEAWRKNDLKEIQSVYQKSSTVLMVSGGLLFVLFWANIDGFLSFLPESYRVVKEVFLILGLAKFVDMIAGVNVQILATSKKYWKLNLYVNILLIAVLIPLNFILIKNYGILGAAYARLISVTIINFLRGFILYYYEKLTPFKSGIGLTVALLALNMLGLYYLNIWSNNYEWSQMNVIFAIILKSIILCLINVPIIYKIGASKEINDTIDQVIVKIRKFF